jgi:hypothetical protein
MKRDDAINMLVNTVSFGKLMEAVAASAELQATNWTLQMNNSLFAVAGTDSGKSWFTSFAVLAIKQKALAANIIQQARALDSKPALSEAEKKKLIAVVQTFAKITKADAGRALD